MIFSAVNDDGKTIYYNIISATAPMTVAVTYESYGSITQSYSGSVVIPSSVTYSGNTYYVTSIGHDAFYSCGLTSVTIPNCVTSIGPVAFRYCSDFNGSNYS